jgi:hypothetical protein
MHMRTLVVLAVAAALLVPLGSADAAKKKLRKPKHGIQLRPAPYVVGPGEDREWCEYVRAPVKKPMYVSGFEVRMPPGAHHFVVWGYGGDVQDDSKFPAKPVESVGCTGLGPGEIAPRVIIPLQSPNKRFDLPKGLALRIDPGQQLWLNPHLRNPSATEPITPEIRANFYATKPTAVKHLVEGLIAGNMPDINIPAGGDQRLTAEFTAPVNLNIVFLATHQHRLGTYANIELVDQNGVPQQIYESYRWDHPPDLWPQAPIRLAKGDKMRITCEWHNTDQVPIHFGPNTTDEMCFILGFYYRDDGDTEEIPFGQCLPSASGLLCPLAPKVN